ncbi:MAG: YihA family ribosome biogenesis GTP-binding protein [Clostridia bacterium]|nr:YihA family ribosome biogenesis GTP-binding protein [Clostridia bacterium]
MSENFLIKNAKYLTSAVDKKNFLKDKSEIAFVGRSNVGKSSLINNLVNQKRLAKTSSTAGLTKMVNYFLINENFYFVDLPGYGYSKTGKKHQELWSELIEDYLLLSPNLKLVLMLVDIRHKPSQLDQMMQKFLYCNNIPYRIIATKADKIAKSKIPQYLNEIAKVLQITANNIIPHSSNDGLNKQKILNMIGEIV